MANQAKTPGELLAERLAYKPENSGIRYTDEEMGRVTDFCEGYKRFLDAAKTEREAVEWTVKLLEKNGFVPFDPGARYKAGDKVYLSVKGKAVIFSAIGLKPLSEGVRIVASHVDSPRIDLKQRPLYEEAQFAMLKTHYYGGIRKYQWVAVPLALHGVVVKRDGESVSVNIGEDDGDPVFVINDLLPHLSQEQNKRTLPEGIKGEELNVLVGSLPFRDDRASEKVKLNILNILNEKYGVTEADFISAELCLVPAAKARDVGFDRSMIGAYGHDDRVCAYTSVMAGLDNLSPEYTWVNILADKEEIGSDGNTGLQGRYLEYFICDLAAAQGLEGRGVLQRSECLSADVNAAFDPTFPDAFEKKNTCYINYGTVMTKYTGSRGKSGSSDASAEFVGRVRRIFEDAGVHWQTGELGKVDGGGGGTVAKFIANLGPDVVDIGVPVLSMHAPCEIVGKTDVYSTWRGFSAFMGAKG
ncbi:MAG: aminopeptidase [Oscillospiraceae bacterium]|jgi:aspartyl aminopeptidase|nr:aminopeptidase [Oscillospiraceae bacterium]